MRISHIGLVLNFFLVTLATSVNVILGSLKFINLLDIKFYYFYSPKVVNIVIFSPSTDLWIWSVSLFFIILEIFSMKMLCDANFPRWTIVPCLLSLVSLPVFLINDRIASFFAVPLGFIIVGLSTYYGNGYLVTRREEAATLTLMCNTGLLILFELASVSSWIMNILDYEIPFAPSFRWRFPLIDLQLFNVLYPLTSWLFLFFLYSWIWIPASKYILHRIQALSNIFSRIRSNFSPVQSIHSKLKLDNKPLTFGLLISLTTAIFITYYPCIHLPNSTLVGVDSIFYYDRLKEMMQRGPLIAFERDRPFFNLLLYFIRYVVASPPETVLRIMPMIFAVCLNLAVFWFVKVGTGNELLALMSSFFSTFSFQTTLGVFVYSLANWFAIVETFLLLVCLLKSLEKHSRKYTLISALIGIALLLTHPYTWNVVIVILVSYLVWIFLRRRPEEKVEIASVTFLLAANLLFYAIYTLTPIGIGIGSAEGATLNTVASNISISNLLHLQDNLASMVQIWVGGLLGNPLLMILAVAGMFSIMDFTKRFNRIVLLWVMIPSLALLAIPPELYYRPIYLIPMQIQAAAGVYWMVNKLKEMKGNLKASKTRFHMLDISIVILIVLFLLNYSLRSVDKTTIYVV